MKSATFCCFFDKKIMKKLLLMSVLCVGLTSVAMGQNNTAQSRPVRGTNLPPTIQCEEMKKLMEQVRTHRSVCETCKTNLSQRGFGQGPGPGQGRGQGNGRGPGGPPQSK